MDSDTAGSMLPHFLHSLHALDTDVHTCLVVVALDARAMSTCRSLHIPELCYLLDVSSLQDQNGWAYYIDLGERLLVSGCGDAEQEALHDAHDGWHAGWKKTELIRDALEQGHSIFFTDMDIVRALPRTTSTRVQEVAAEHRHKLLQAGA